MQARIFSHRASHEFIAWVAVAVVLSGGAASAAPIFRASSALAFTGGPGQLASDLVWTGNGAAAVYAKPVGSSNSLAFYRLGPDAQVLVERVHSLAPWPCYEPSMAFDGDSFGVAVSAFTQAFFLRLSAAGDIVTGPVQLPGLPSGAGAGRTAAFKVLWTGEAYAVFGLWLEREFPLQDLTSGNFYTHLRYWLFDRQGQVLAQHELRTLAPTSYPSGEGAEKNYFDVAWTGQVFFVTYYGESESGPPFSVYYRTFDLAGGSVRSESPLFAAQVAQGPKLAFNGQGLAVTALKTISMPDPNAGNYMYLRCFTADGTPRGTETAYGQRLGFGPVVSWAGDRFLTAYCVMYDMATLGYTLMFDAFDESGHLIGAEQPLRNSKGSVVLGRMALGVDLQLVGQGNTLYGKAQNSDAFAIQTTPLWFTMNNDRVVPPVLQLARQGNQAGLRWPADAAPFRLQQRTDLLTPQWADVLLQPALEGDHYTLALPLEGTRFYRLAR
jgi:hypothetical protein